MDTLEGVSAKIVELEGLAAQARQEGDKELFRSLQRQLAALREERLALLPSQGVWV